MRDRTWKLRIAPIADGWRSQELMTGDEPVVAQLFHLQRDPYEQFDVAEQHPDVVARLRAELVRFAEETGAKLHFTP